MPCAEVLPIANRNYTIFVNISLTVVFDIHEWKGVHEYLLQQENLKNLSFFPKNVEIPLIYNDLSDYYLPIYFEVLPYLNLTNYWTLKTTNQRCI